MRRRRSGADSGVVGSLRSCPARRSRTLIDSNNASISGMTEGRWWSSSSEKKMFADQREVRYVVVTMDLYWIRRFSFYFVNGPME